MKVKYLPVKQGKDCNINAFPNFHRTGSIIGMKKRFYGKDALLVRCGNYIYNVTSKPSIYYHLAKQRSHKMKMQSITIIGRRWFERTNGNTYFSAQILVDNVLVHTIPFQYGYGDHYRSVAFQWLDDNGYTHRTKSPQGIKSAPWRYCEENKIKYYSTVTDVSRKRDL